MGLGLSCIMLTPGTSLIPIPRFSTLISDTSRRLAVLSNSERWVGGLFGGVIGFKACLDVFDLLPVVDNKRELLLGTCTVPLA